MVQPGLKGEAERCQPCKAGPPGRIKHLAPDGVSARLRERVARVPGDRMPNAVKAAVSGRDLGFQNPCDLVESRKSACPTIARQSRVGPYWPLALIAAVPLTNSVSPTGFISTGPSARYIEPHSMKTVSVIL
jgi:hypothetical protein